MPTLMERLSNGKTGPKIYVKLPDENAFEIPDDLSGLDADPAPDATVKQGKRPARKAQVVGGPAPTRVTPVMQKRISAEIEAYVEFAALPLLMRDPTCGGALHEQAKPIAEAIAQILSRYPDLAAKFLATGVLGDWLKLGLALQPVLKALWTHHVVKPPEDEQETAVNPNVAETLYPSFRPGR